MLKVLSVLGTRPEAIKMAPVIMEMDRYPGQVKSLVCATAQHREMLDQVLDLFHITPDYDLDLMHESQTPTQVVSLVLKHLELIFERERPDWVLVQGDTSTVMAAAIAAFYARIKVGHVEAGLRTHDKWRPFPEEINRKIAGVTADLHFAPTQQARKNLLNEGVLDGNIIITGNPVIDAVQWVIKQSFDINDLGFKINEGKVILVTAHRRENFGRPLVNICRALEILALKYPDFQIVYPVHPNPKVQNPVNKFLKGIPNIILLPPLDYLSLINLVEISHIVLTDSGGIQEEAPSLGKPVLVLRDVTERPEAVEAGTVRLVGTDQDKIIEEASRLIENQAHYQRMAQAVNPYGDGQASRRIVNALLGKHINI